MPSEFALIDRYFHRPTRHTILGVGDDGALLRPGPGMELAISTDMLVEGTHFFPDADPEALGWKALAVNVSDMAAMGAQPRWALLALSLPDADEAWIAAFAQGFFACAEAFGIDIVGGDTTRGPRNLCITILGETPVGRALTRAGAQPEDDIWVSGTPGLAALGLTHLQGRCVLPATSLAPCLAALHRPQPRVTLGLALRGIATAAIDISDGLLADLGHLLKQSALNAQLWLSRLPTAALAMKADPQLALNCLLGGGDDYELLFTAPRQQRENLQGLAGALGVDIHRIGNTSPSDSEGSGNIEVLDANGESITLPRSGFDHFNAP